MRPIRNTTAASSIRKKSGTDIATAVIASTSQQEPTRLASSASTEEALNGEAGRAR